MTDQQFRMPAEWEPHAATWLAWPHNPDTWPGLVDRMPAVWAQMIRALAPGEDIHLLVNDEDMECEAMRTLRQLRADPPNLHIHCIPTNDAWMRDLGPIFVKCGAETRIVDWDYNAWGGKYPPWDDSNRVPGRVAELLGLPSVKPGMILEGGSIETNGAGLLLTTERCLLNPNRNPHLTRQQIEGNLREHLGVEKILWLGDGIVGDDTDGHVDDIARFVSADTVVTAVEENPRDENHSPLRANLDRLARMRDLDGQMLNVIELPMPHPVIYEDERLPASYANFYIANAAVLVPLYRDAEHDAQALETLSTLFPDREIIGIDCTEVVWGLGAFHCLTMQQPR